jgi:hypothetical protein
VEETVSTISLFEADALWIEPLTTAPAPATSAADDDSDAATLDALIRSLHAQVPAEGTKTLTGEELADVLMVPASERATLLAAFRAAEVKADGSAHARFASKVRVVMGDNTLVLGPDLHAKVFADRFEVSSGFGIKVGFITPAVRSVARGEEDGRRGIFVRTSMGSRFLPF